MFNLFSRKPPQSTSASADRSLIDLAGVHKVYTSNAGDTLALNEIDLKVERGEFVGIIGKSGAGKSTLINMLTGIDKPDRGEIFVDGSPIHQMDEHRVSAWRGKNMGVVFQFFQLIPRLSCLQNVMLPMDFCNVYPTIQEQRERAMHLLEQMEIAEHAHKLPSAVSGGQRQRVAIARALANNPAVLAADEPTGNLDSKTADAVFKIFESLVEAGTTIVMVTHDKELADRVGRVIQLVDGEIVSDVKRSSPTPTPP